MKRASLLTIAVVFLLFWALSGVAAADKCVRFPYAVQNPATGWATGIAITNYASTAISNLTLDIVKSDGSWHSFLGNYRKDLGTLEEYAMKVGTLSSLYGSLPSDPNGRYWVEIWHAGAQSFGVCLFVVNTNSGAGEGFGFQTYECVTRAHTFEEYEMPDLVK